MIKFKSNKRFLLFSLSQVDQNNQVKLFYKIKENSNHFLCFHLDMITSDTLNSFIERDYKPTRSCGGPACLSCGKCTDWHYDGNICKDYEQLLRRRSENILHRHRWFVYPDATCTEDIVEINETNDDDGHMTCLQNNHIDSFIRHVCQCDQ